LGKTAAVRNDGTLHLLFNTIVTPSSRRWWNYRPPQAKVSLVGNLISDGAAGRTSRSSSLFAVGTAASRQRNAQWFSGAFGSVAGTALDPENRPFRRANFKLFIDSSRYNYRLTPQAARLAHTPLLPEKLEVPGLPGKPQTEVELPLAWQYRHPASQRKRPTERGPHAGGLRPRSRA